MNTRTSLGLFIVTALATRLVGGGAQETPVTAPRATPAPPVAAAPVVSFKYSDELRERLNRRVTPDRGRNPFLYGTRHATAPAARRDEPAPMESAPVPAVPPEPPAPRIKLSGIATNLVDGAPVLTAIVNDGGSVAIVKAGDTLPSGLKVVRVDELSMTLVDAAGVTQTVRLP